MITRRALGFGLLGATALFTTGVVVNQSNPGLLGSLGLPGMTGLRGVAGSEKTGLLADGPAAQRLSESLHARVAARSAGSVELCRDPAILQTRPDFLWPSVERLVDLARQGGAAVRRAAVVLTSPLVFNTWEPIAAGLVASGYARTEGGATVVDTERLVGAIAAGRSWAELGSSLPGSASLRATDPNRSGSGLLLAGLAANALSGGTATAQALGPHRAALLRMFQAMRDPPANSAQLFGEFIDGGPAAAPLTVGYESQLLEWILADPRRWAATGEGGGARPVMLYPSPTLLATHTLVSLTPAADALIDALLTPQVQDAAWLTHGFRSARGAAGARTQNLIAGRILPALPPVQALPPADVLGGVLAEIAAARG